MPTVLFYISGHGYGHVVRTSETIRELQRLCPDWRILARTQAPPHMLPEYVQSTAADIEPGVVEREAGVVIDEDETRRRLLAFLGRWDATAAEEARFARLNGVDLIVADVPAIAGDIAHLVGIPCIAISNFTWDWIYEPYASEHVTRLEEAYSRMDVLLRLPFGQRERLKAFRKVVDAPLVARKTPSSAALGTRWRVLLGSRAQVAEETLARAKAEGPEFEFVVPPVGKDFPAALASCDLVLAKLGFSLVAEAIAAGKRLLYPPRVGFREDTILEVEVANHLAALPIPLDEFFRGNWASYLRTLASLPPVVSNLRTDGARFCAEFLAGYMKDR